MPPKVCILTTVHSPFDVRIFHKQAKTLSQAGFDVTLIAQHDRNETIDGIKILPLPKARNRIQRMLILTLKVFLIALKQKADIYHLHDPELLPWGKILQILGRRVVFDMHENYPKAILTKHWINPKIRRVMSSFYKTVECFLLAGTPVIFAEKSYENDYYWVRRHTSVLNMPMIDEMANLKEPKYSVPTLGYIGEVTSERGSLLTLKSIQLLREQGYTVHWECIGKVHEAHMADLIRLCDHHNLEGIRFRGYLSPYDSWHILSRCHIGLAVLQPIPNYIESYPTKMFEYMALGLPIVVANFPLYREVVEHCRCGLTVNPQDPREVAQAIRWLIDHPYEAEAMGQRAQKAVYKHYNWNKEIKKLLVFYENIFFSEKEGNLKKMETSLVNPIDDKKDLPFISIIIPCRNEEKFISKCLDSIIANDFPKNKLEVLVVDGISEDRTREVVKGYIEKFLFIRLLDNPKKITPSSLNMGIKNAKGEIIMRMDSHATYEKEYITKCVKYLTEYGADNVGGIWVTLPGSDTLVANSIALVLSHPFGVGNAYFRIGLKEPKSVDTVPFGCYKREVFENIGLFDEDLVRNQDDEFNLRLLKNGGKILLFPDIVSYYYSRDQISKLWKMYFQYGYFKPLVAQKVGGLFTWRQTIPSLLVSFLFLTGLLSFLGKNFFLLFLMILGTYACVSFFFSFSSALKRDIRLVPFLMASFATTHFSYGVGYLKGVWDLIIWKKHLKNEIVDMDSTR